MSNTRVLYALIRLAESIDKPLIFEGSVIKLGEWGYDYSSYNLEEGLFDGLMFFGRLLERKRLIDTLK